MKTSAIAIGLALGLAASASFAGGIQIDPTGGGSIAGSKFISGLGSSTGSMLAKDSVSGTGAGNGSGGTVYAQNAFGLGSFGVPGGELTFNLVMPVTSTLTGTAGTVGATMQWLQQIASVATIDVYFQATGADANNDAVTGGSPTGSTYTNGHKILSGTVTIDPNSTFAFSELSVGTAGTLATNDLTPSISGSGSVVFLVDFNQASTDTGYVVNGVDQAVIDMSASTALSLLYSKSPSPIVNAGTTFNGAAAVARNFGADGTNDFTCNSLGTCDLEMMMNSTLLFTAGRVPEPETLALLGAGLVVVGAAARRRRKAKV